MLDLGRAAETDADEHGGIGLLLDKVANDRAQSRPLGELDVIVLQHRPHPHGGVVGRVGAGFDMPAADRG